jgi:hypothetical protein
MYRRAVPVSLVGLLLLCPAMPAAAAVVIDKLMARPVPARSAKGYPQEFEFEITVKDRGMTRILGCDVMLDFGDGTPAAQQHFMDGGARRAVVKHVYEAPGTYAAVAHGRAVAGGRACDGEKRAQVTVTGEPSAPEGAALSETPPVTAGCPAGWSLVPGSQSGNRFRCRSEHAAPKIECHGGTKYFEQDGTIGCQ